jgi:hypothetical protein
VSEYRTPEEDRAQLEQRERIKRALDKAVTDGASILVAMKLGESQAVVDRWVDALYDGLRDGLVDGRAAPHDCPLLARQHDRLAAIVLLLTDRIEREAADLLRGLRTAGGEGR